jgi:hypothetical protein
MWHMHYGKYWMIQWCFSWWFSFGIHLDLKHRINSVNGIGYGPYVDIHFLWFIFSFGINPVYSSEIGQYIGRGGERGK